jgi:hypothetical protein
MAGSRTAADYTPITQRERTRLYVNSMVNPILYFKAGLSGAIDLKNDKPQEWDEGASGWGIRTANILGQYAIQRTVTFGMSSALHEDNRYFGSGEKGFWNRTGHAVAGSVLARHDNGKQYPSISLFGGYAAAAFASRLWQPPSTRSAGDGAVSFGLSIGYNTLASVAKEFLPDLVRSHAKNRKAAGP